MPSRKPSSPVLDTSEDDASSSDALELAEQAEAEAAEAEAVAAAARARARAIRLRNQVAADNDAEAAAPDEAADAGEDVETEAVEAEPLDEAAPEAEAEAVEGKSTRRLPRVRVSRLFWKVLASCLTLIVIAGLLGFSGWMIWQHRQAEHRQQLAAEYTAAARQTVVTLMSLDFNHAQDAVKNILDNSTGEFREDFEAQSKDFVKLAQDAKVVTEASVTGAAVDTMSDTDAVVLVSVNTKVTNTTGANKQPRPWRVAVDMVREGDQIKLSKVEFVP
ncbi:tetratricopeptide repeat protein [Mycolicibacterium neworleansense]|uniref:Membrane protein n=1 Tax=Mycolicibacterium neworleansense TaxID=146018 RepID=A0A0H5RIL6_9MYCO|nr:tetratricopeptide repeat protein [Mycolicibacterium neworleansense]MCV7362240.1 tetratricopeptide repeat protein [Mycolicibacterium neworleansense]CRZ13352.1 membrane protein [Mycolicibacterium neworleansense]